jgi:ABC-type sugar transport system ATPase subunit/ribose/xylose/arabinose/galactoside ABC-type transport system permease subunit
VTQSTARTADDVAPLDAALVEFDAVGKIFGSTVACEDVSFRLAAGEVVALVGENGAGKSTCVKLLAGVHRPDAGTILVDGQPVDFADARSARAAGVAVVHQHPELFAELSVAENVFAGNTLRRGGVVQWAEMERRSKETLAELGLTVDTTRPLAQLRVSEQQLVEIARALAADARVLVLDEPTAALTATEALHLFTVVRRLRDRGVGILFVGHRLEEILALSDRIVVLRDGHVVGRPVTAETSKDDLVTLMVGRSLADMYDRTPGEVGAEVLRLQALTRSGFFEDISITVRAGEVVGLAGLVGSGRTEVARAVFGVDRPESGEIMVDGVARRWRSPADAMAAGVAYVSEDRRGQSLIEEFSILDNAALPVLDQATSGGLVRTGRTLALVAPALQRMRLRFERVAQSVASLSGGNQQKVVLAKWLATRPRLLILDEPTQGVDIGAKAEVHRIIDELAAAGMAILMISSDMPELIGGCDRVYVMNRGRVVEELGGADIDQIAIGRAATSVADEPASAGGGDDGDPRVGDQGLRARLGSLRQRLGGRPELALAVALLALIVPLSALNPNFYALDNLQDLADYASIVGLVCLGEMLVILTRNIDLSVASVLGLSAYVGAQLMRDVDGLPIVAAVLAGVLLGAACGALNGLLVGYGGIPSIVVTLGTLAIFRGVLSQISSGDRIKPVDVPEGWLAWTKASLGPISTVNLIALLVFLAAGYALTRTIAGRSIYLAGSNPAGATLLGVRTERRILAAFTLSGILAGLAGSIWASYYPYVDGQVAVGLELIVIAAVVVGGVALRGGAGSVLGVVIGVIGLLTLRNVLVVAGVRDQYLQAVYGASIIAAVSVDILLSRRRLARAQRIR